VPLTSAADAVTGSNSSIESKSHFIGIPFRVSYSMTELVSTRPPDLQIVRRPARKTSPDSRVYRKMAKVKKNIFLVIMLHENPAFDKGVRAYGGSHGPPANPKPRIPSPACRE